MNRKIVLLGPAVASLSLLWSLGGCAGLPGGCILPVPDPVPRPWASFQAIRLGEMDWGGRRFAPVPPGLVQEAMDRAIERAAAQPYRSDMLIVAAFANQTLDHQGLSDYVRDAYKHLVRNPDGRDPNTYRWIHEDHPLRGAVCGPGTDETTCQALQALWCDRVEPPSDLPESIRAKARSGAFAATVGLIALSDLRERGCFDRTRVLLAIDGTARALEAHLADEMRADEDALYSAPMALLALMLAERAERVRPEWISSIRTRLEAELGKPEPDAGILMMFASTLALASHAPLDPTWATPPAPPPAPVAQATPFITEESHARPLPGGGGG